MHTFPLPTYTHQIIPNFVTEDWLKKCEPGLLPKIERDFHYIQARTFDDLFPASYNNETELYLATAGAPCSAKSTELDIELASGSDPRYARIGFFDPDRGVMNYMGTYQDMLSAGTKAILTPQVAARVAYDRARPGSNIICNLMVNKAYDGGYHIAHGTTGTAPTFGKITLANLGKRGYKRRLLLVAADDDLRIAAGHKRITTEAHYQVDPSDFVSKGRAFIERHGDYFAYGDHAILLHKSELETPATRAAEYKDGQRIILDQRAFNDYVDFYEAGRAKAAKKNVTLPDWSALEATYTRRFAGPTVPRLGAATPPQATP